MNSIAFPRPAAERGAALLIFVLALLCVLLGGFLGRLNSAPPSAEREARTDSALTQARDALIGFAATYRDTHANQVFGYLPCPDNDNDGDADLSCGKANVSVVGRLPWKTLGLPPLRDGSGECLWYALSGNAKDTAKTAVYNWDTPGQFVIHGAGGTPLAGADAHQRPLAVIFAARSPLAAQSRTAASTSPCGGGNAADYLEGLGTLGTGDTTIVVADADSIRNGRNNDRATWITSKDIFDRVKGRSDFKTDVDTLINEFADYLNGLPADSLPSASPGASKGMQAVLKRYNDDNRSLPKYKANLLANWEDNLLYAGGPDGHYSVNGGVCRCRVLLIFGGERTTRAVAPLVAQTRALAAEKGSATAFGDPAMYLEGSAAELFPGQGDYAGASQYDPAHPDADIIRCINGREAPPAVQP
jgi:type II secretory pathway pseudopilin PulG